MGGRWATDVGAGMRAITVVTVLAAVGLTGCGGGPSDPSAAERRAALDKWTRTADAACEKANQAIGKRGWPVNLVDLDRLTVRAMSDMQSAMNKLHTEDKPPAKKEPEKKEPPVKEPPKPQPEKKADAVAKQAAEKKGLLGGLFGKK